MTARILVVDDLLPNVKLLEARLTAEYFQVQTAMTGAEALSIVARGDCDVVLLDVMMPAMDGFEVCRRLKSDPATAHIPVIMVTALDHPRDRVRGLDCGADDFLTKPIDELALIARVRSVARLKLVIDELRARVLTSASLGISDPAVDAFGEETINGRVLLIDDQPRSCERILGALTPMHKVDLESNPQEALFRAAEGDYDLVIAMLGLAQYDGLRLCSQLRALERTRQIPILAVAEPEDRARILRGLDLGVNDYLIQPVDTNELVARVKTQLRRKRYVDALRQNVQASIELAIVDPLTSLNNRRYLETHLAALLDNASGRGRPLSLMMLDIDHFKTVNDTFGHSAGDEVLKAVALRSRRVIRAADLMCRFGGEEFVVVMPDTALDTALRIAERVRMAIESDPFAIDGGKSTIKVTVSIGLADRGRDANPDLLIKRADRALNRSKHGGRNRVTTAAAA
jgi:two-component system, cell cycle response regulator